MLFSLGMCTTYDLLTLNSLVPLISVLHDLGTNDFFDNFANGRGFEDVFLGVGFQDKFVIEIASHELRDNAFEFFCFGDYLKGPFEKYQFYPFESTRLTRV